jgi:hypothetical protein
MEVRDLCPGPVLGKDWSGPFSAGPYIGLGNHREGGGGGVWGFLNTIKKLFLIYYIKNGMTQGHMFVAKRSRISHDVVVA